MRDEQHPDTLNRGEWSQAMAGLGPAAIVVAPSEFFGPAMLLRVQ